VGAQVSRGGEIYDIGTGLTLGPNGGERRQVHLNGAPQPALPTSPKWCRSCG
jgi:DNA replication and repair protein RecF